MYGVRIMYLGRPYQLPFLKGFMGSRAFLLIKNFPLIKCSVYFRIERCCLVFMYYHLLQLHLRIICFHTLSRIFPSFCFRFSESRLNRCAHSFMYPTGMVYKTPLSSVFYTSFDLSIFKVACIEL